MFFDTKRIKKSPITFYGVSTLSNHGISDDEHNEYVDIIGDLDNVEMVFDIAREDWNPEQLKEMEEKIKHLNLSDPIFIVNEINAKEIENAVKALKKKHRWKDLFGTLTMEDYMIVEHHAIFKLDQAVTYKDNADDVVTFLECELERERNKKSAK
ncbi:hypothetical protein [Cytobacillus purgationiresistens]|uniref:Uncharacterized protein n=1 Tax=Cytobacillus purgationiresistens TaxID=863449 RepID=A0ABU0APV9_9BACI|nr:hypothetical protein [Cytobacillus purgationiresistens]MDQ0273326.1 hypothetical protein [Cytobacillus purgationiresistens]